MTMVDSLTGEPTTGFSYSGLYFEDEINDNKHKELMKEIPLINGCEWFYSYDFETVIPPNFIKVR